MLQLGPIKIINTRLFGTPSPLPLAKQDSKVGALVKYFLSVVIDHVSSSSSHAAPSSASLSAAHDSLNSAQCRRMKILILDGELPPHALGHGDRAHRQQSKQTFRLGPTAPASLPPAVLLLPRVLQCQDDPSWLGGRTPGSAQKHSTKFSTQSQTLCHLPTSEASPPKTSSPPSIGSTTEQKPR